MIIPIRATEVEQTSADTITFDPEFHHYTREGRVYTSVTTILKQMGCHGDAVRFYRDSHRQRGQRVHSICSQIAWLEHPNSVAEWDGTVGYPDLLPYAEQFSKWCKDTTFEVLHAERAVWDDQMMLAGTLDLVGYIRGRLVIVDIKTGTLPASVNLQTAAYQHMAEPLLGIKIEDRYSLLLQDGTSYKFRACSNPQDWQIFVSLYNGWKWRAAHSLLPRNA